MMLLLRVLMLFASASVLHKDGVDTRKDVQPFLSINAIIGLLYVVWGVGTLEKEG